MTLYTAYKKEKKGSKEAKSMLNVINNMRARVKLPRLDDNLDVMESKGFFTRGKTPEQKGKNLLRVMKSDLEKKLKGVPHSLSPDSSGTRIVIKVKSSDVDKTKKLVGLPNITQVVSERKTIKVGEDALLGDGNPHYALVSDRRVLATGTKEDMLELSDETGGRVWLTKSDIGDIVESNTEYVKDIARAMRGKGHENLKFHLKCKDS